MIPKPSSCIDCPLYEWPHGKKMGFTHPCGTGMNGVMIVAEAPGKDEEAEGMGLVGKSGYALFQQLKRVDIERDDFTIFNTIACRPPDNKLVGMSYEKKAIEHCRPNLEAAINAAKQTAKDNGKTFVIVTLGVTPFKEILELDGKKDSEQLKKDYYAYPFWSAKYSCWVLAAPHPAYLLRGNTHLWPIVQFVFTRALEIASNGFRYDELDYTLDRGPVVFDEWIAGYVRSLGTNPDNPLSYDIETPYKKKVKDEDEVGKEEAALDDDHTILRIAFAYEHEGKFYVISVVWDAQHMKGIETLFATAPYLLGWNSDKYDYPRVSHYVKVFGIGLDGMVAWHILNSALPKALGFVTPFYWQTTNMWKHMSESHPAFYNAKDAHAALIAFIGIKRDLVANNLWHVYQRHWIELHKALKFMQDTGVLRDNEMRADAEAKMSAIIAEVESAMEEAIPLEARAVKIYKKPQPGLRQVTQRFPERFCAKCGVELKRIWKAHQELCSDPVNIEVPYCRGCGVREPKKWAKHPKLCKTKDTLDFVEVVQKVPETTIDISRDAWVKPLDFKISKVRMTAYQKVLKHKAIIDRKEKKVTFNADALEKLMKLHPEDKLYPLILKFRKIQKLLTVYIGVTEYKEIEVDDDYQLQSGETWA